MTATLLQGHALDGLRQMPSESYVKLSQARLRADNPLFAGGER